MYKLRKITKRGLRGAGAQHLTVNAMVVGTICTRMNKIFLHSIRRQSAALSSPTQPVIARIEKNKYDFSPTKS